MYEACSARPPVVLPFRSGALGEPNTAAGVSLRAGDGQVAWGAATKPPVTRGWRAGTVQLRLPGRGLYVWAPLCSAFPGHRRRSPAS